MRLATTGGPTAAGQPILDYEALYPIEEPWISEGKGGLPVLNIRTAANAIVHSDGTVLEGKCNWTNFGDPNFEIGSRAIGVNPIGMYLGLQESVLPAAHFDIVLPGAGLGPTGGAGGVNQVKGDYLFRDQASFGNSQGLWGILRVD